MFEGGFVVEFYCIGNFRNWYSVENGEGCFCFYILDRLKMYELGVFGFIQEIEKFECVFVNMGFDMQFDVGFYFQLCQCLGIG